MGTRFMCTAESPIHDNIKEQIVADDERAHRPHLPHAAQHRARRAATRSASEVIEIERAAAQLGGALTPEQVAGRYVDIALHTVGYLPDH